MMQDDWPPRARTPYRPRWANYLWARYRGYFWLPCPLCGHKFGGHEWSGSIPKDQPGVRIGVCPRCKDRPETRLPTQARV